MVSGGYTPFGSQFCSTDWVIKLAPIRYHVDLTDSNNPKLLRTQNGTDSVVMEQILGFKIGAAIWDSINMDFNGSNYYYRPEEYSITNGAGAATPVPYNFTLVRAVRASLIGRTTPNLSAQYTFRNSFDGGPYQVQGSAIVVNPRNLSMNDY